MVVTEIANVVFSNARPRSEWDMDSAQLPMTPQSKNSWMVLISTILVKTQQQARIFEIGAPADQNHDIYIEANGINSFCGQGNRVVRTTSHTIGAMAKLVGAR